MAKPKSRSGGKPAPEPPKSQEQAPSLSKLLLQATAWIVLAALSSPISQLNLSPVYGSIPATRFHRQAMMVSLALSSLIPRGSKNPLLRNLSQAPGVIAALAPFVQWLAFSYSMQTGPIYGPLFVELLTFYPLVLTSVRAALEIVEDLGEKGVSVLAAPLSPIVISLTAFYLLERFFSPELPMYMGSADIFNRVSLWVFLASAYAFLSKPRIQGVVVPLLIITLLYNPHYHAGRNTTRLRASLDSEGWFVLERKESITGYISVLETKEKPFQLLRCDHSLLGGEWLVTPQLQEQGVTTRESVYAVFSMLEAVRLVKTPSISNPDTSKSGLIIGLGIGTAPTAFIAHGINTTIVELDPVVHEFATKYFALPSNHTAILRDAVPWVASAAHTSPSSYDFIIHDVFTGGAEPASLFTLEFLSDLSTLLTKNGVIAINYAGILHLPSTALVLRTIAAVFPVCRMYRDVAPTPDAEPNFVNMVVFCLSPESESKRIEFRKPVEADFLESVGRRNNLLPQAEQEIPFPPPVAKGEGEKGESGEPLLRKGDLRALEKYRVEGAVRHWWIMRGVVPAKVWEMW